MLYSEFQKAFKQFCIQSIEFLVTEKVEFIRFDIKSNQLRKMIFSLKYINQFEFDPNEKLDQVAEFMHKKKTDESVYIEVNFFFSTTVLTFIDKISDLEQALNGETFSLMQVQN